MRAHTPMTEDRGNAALLQRQANIERNNTRLRALGLQATVADFHDTFFKSVQTHRKKAPAKPRSNVCSRRSTRAVHSEGTLAEDSFFPKCVLDDIRLEGRRPHRMPEKKRAAVEWGDEYVFEDDTGKENAGGWHRVISRNSEFKDATAKQMAFRLSQEDVTFQTVRAKNLTTEELMAAAFGDSKRSTGTKGAMLRVFKEVEDGKHSQTLHRRFNTRKRLRNGNPAGNNQAGSRIAEDVLNMSHAVACTHIPDMPCACCCRKREDHYQRTQRAKRGGG